MIQLLILDKMRSFLWQLELRFWIYGVIKIWGPIDPNVVTTLQILGWKLILIFDEFIRFTFWFWIKWGFLLKIAARFLGLWFGKFFSQICPKLVLWMQATGWRFIFTFDNFTGFSSWFWVKRGFFCQKWSHDSEVLIC